MLADGNVLNVTHSFQLSDCLSDNCNVSYAQKDEADKRSLQYCTYCEGHKVPRSHHCRKCQRSVENIAMLEWLKMLSKHVRIVRISFYDASLRSGPRTSV